MTHIRYEEGKVTQVGNGDRELSHFPGPVGSQGTESGTLNHCTTSLGFELLCGCKIKNTNAHKYTD